MDIIHKLTEYSIDEVKTAERYIQLAYKIDDATMASKLAEIASDELEHCNILRAYAKKMSESEKDTDVDCSNDPILTAYIHMYDDWYERVKYKVDSFKSKK